MEVEIGGFWWIFGKMFPQMFPHVYPEAPKWGNKLQFLGKQVGKQTAESIVNKGNTEDSNDSNIQSMKRKLNELKKRNNRE